MLVYDVPNDPHHPMYLSCIKIRQHIYQTSVSISSTHPIRREGGRGGCACVRAIVLTCQAFFHHRHPLLQMSEFERKD